MINIYSLLARMKVTLQSTVNKKKYLSKLRFVEKNTSYNKSAPGKKSKTYNH